MQLFDVTFVFLSILLILFVLAVELKLLSTVILLKQSYKTDYTYSGE